MFGVCKTLGPISIFQCPGRGQMSHTGTDDSQTIRAYRHGMSSEHYNVMSMSRAAMGYS